MAAIAMTIAMATTIIVLDVRRGILMSELHDVHVWRKS
jgi:hypothetical protein